MGPPLPLVPASPWPGAEAVERGPEDRLEIVRAAVDGGDGDEGVEDLVEHEVAAYLWGALRDREVRTAGGDQAVAVLTEERVAFGVLEQLEADMTPGAEEIEELVQPDIEPELELPVVRRNGYA